MGGPSGPVRPIPAPLPKTAAESNCSSCFFWRARPTAEIGVCALLGAARDLSLKETLGGLQARARGDRLLTRWDFFCAEHPDFRRQP